MNYRYIRDKITDLRVKQNLSERELSNRAGFSEKYVQRISSGKSNPSISGLFKLTRELHITPSDFFIDYKYDDIDALQTQADAVQSPPEEVFHSIIDALPSLSREQQYSILQMVLQIQRDNQNRK